MGCYLVVNRGFVGGEFVRLKFFESYWWSACCLNMCEHGILTREKKWISVLECARACCVIIPLMNHNQEKSSESRMRVFSVSVISRKCRTTSVTPISRDVYNSFIQRIRFSLYFIFNSPKLTWFHILTVTLPKGLPESTIIYQSILRAILTNLGPKYCWHLWRPLHIESDNSGILELDSQYKEGAKDVINIWVPEIPWWYESYHMIHMI